jgi:hypothetical protein
MLQDQDPELLKSTSYNCLSRERIEPCDAPTNDEVNKPLAGARDRRHSTRARTEGCRTTGEGKGSAAIHGGSFVFLKENADISTDGYPRGATRVMFSFCLLQQ